MVETLRVSHLQMLLHCNADLQLAAQPFGALLSFRQQRVEHATEAV